MQRKRKRHRRHSLERKNNVLSFLKNFIELACKIDRLKVFAVAIGCLCLWATIPFGSVAVWSQSILVVCCLIVALAGRVVIGEGRYTDPETDAVDRDYIYALIAVCMIFAWGFLQCLPAPVRMLSFLQFFARDIYAMLFENKGFSSIAFDCFIVCSTLALWFGYFLFLRVCTKCFKSKEIVKFICGIVVCIGTFQALSAIGLQDSGVFRDSLFKTNRLMGTFSSGNSFGGFILLTLLTTFGVLIYYISSIVEEVKSSSFELKFLLNVAKWKLVLAIMALMSAIIQGLALILSGSRGAILSGLFCAVLLFLWFFYSSGAQKRKAVYKVIFLFAGVILLFGIGGGYSVMTSRFKEMVAAESSIMVRPSIWWGALKMFIAHPLGVGPGCFGEAFARFQGDGFRSYRVYHAHNDFLELLCELGLPGIIPFAGLFLLYVRRVKKFLFLKTRSCSIWLRRGALLAVVAALLHALVDFNLTSRPGVMLTFLVLLSVTLNSNLKSTKDNGVVESESLLSRIIEKMFSKIVLLFSALINNLRSRYAFLRNRRYSEGLFILICLLVVIFSLNTGRSARMTEEGFVSVGGKEDIYFWQDREFLPGEEGFSALEKATRITPLRARSHFVQGLGFIASIGAHKTSMLKEYEERNPDLNWEQLDVVVNAAMLPEKIEAHENALSCFKEARKYSPWSPDIRARIAKSTIVLAAHQASDEIDSVCFYVWQEADKAVALAPNDVATLLAACEALGVCVNLADDEEFKERMLTVLREWGKRVLRLGGNANSRILECWYSVGIPLDKMVINSDLPSRVIWEAYVIYNENDDSERALKCLEALGKACNESEDIEYGFLVNRSVRKNKDKFKRLYVQEKSKWLLRLGRWNDYRGFFGQRSLLHEANIEKNIEGVDASSVSDYMFYLKLKATKSKIGLNSSALVQLSKLELKRGDISAVDNILAELIFVPELDEPDTFKSFLEKAKKHGCVNVDLLLARIKLEEGLFDDAEKLLKEFLAKSEGSFRIRHKLPLMLSKCYAAKGDIKSAEEFIRESVKICSFDENILTHLIKICGPGTFADGSNGEVRKVVDMLSDITPPYGVGMRFLGGKAELVGFDLVGENDGRRTNLRLFWRFSGSVPPDLRVFVGVKSEDGSLVYSGYHTFSEAESLKFAAGSPVLDSTFIVNFLMPLKSKLGDRLLIGLQQASAAGWIVNTEGTSYMELRNWSKYIRDDVQVQGASLAEPEVITGNRDIPSMEALKNKIGDVWSKCRDNSRETPSSDKADDRFTVELAVRDSDLQSGFDLRILGPDGFLIKTGLDSILITSSSFSGLRYGVVAFLEKAFGYRYFLDDKRFEIFPEYKNLFVQSMWTFDAPSFDLRFFSKASRKGLNGVISNEDGKDLSWAVCNGLSSSEAFSSYSFSHSFNRIFSPAKFYDANPEWYPMFDKKRICPTNGNWQICLSAEGIVDRAVQAASEFFEKHPEKNMFSVGINDSERWCECEKCKSLCLEGDQNVPADIRWWSDPYWRFVNKVATRVGSKYPDRRIGAIAYAAVKKPPFFAVEDNVTVFLCQDQSGYFDRQYKKKDFSILNDWNARSSELGKYGYAGLVSWIFPRYCRDEVSLDMKMASGVGVKDIYMEDYWVLGLDGCLPWITARSLWDPSRDPSEMQKEFCESCFGRSSEVMSSYFDELEAVWQNKGSAEWFDGLFDFGEQVTRYPLDVRQNMMQLIDKARKLSWNEPDVLARIDAVSLPLDLAFLIANESDLVTKLISPPENRDDMKEQESSLAELSRTIEKRNQMVSMLDTSPYGVDMKRALFARNSLKRWDEKIELVRAVSTHLLKIIRNASLDISKGR